MVHEAVRPLRVETSRVARALSYNTMGFLFVMLVRTYPIACGHLFTEILGSKDSIVPVTI